MSLIGHARLITGGQNPEYFEDGAVFFEEDVVVEVGTTSDLLKVHPKARFLDAKGKLVFPGFVCTHAHFYGMFARGMALKDDPPANFREILERLWWRLDRALHLEDCYWSAMVFLVQAIRAGTTTIIDHHASPNAIEGSLDTVALATKKGVPPAVLLNGCVTGRVFSGHLAGVRACLCYEVTDRNGPEGASSGIEENVRFIKRCYVDSPDPMLGAMFGLHAAFTVSDDTLRRCVEALDAIPEARGKTGFHIHVAEGPADATHSLRQYGKRTLVRLRDADILMPTTLAAHCVDIDEEERSILKEKRVKVIHNPESNMNNAVGVSDVLGMMKDGIIVGLGTDGMTLDMIQESKTNYLLHKLKQNDPRVMGGETLSMLISNNGSIASQYFNRPVGVLQKGAYADIVMVDYDPPTPLHGGNLPWHLQFGITSDMIDTTIVAGKTVMEGRQLLTLDEKEIMRQARERAPAVWERF